MSGDKEDVPGYGRPPKSKRFKPGQSGNPSGRKSRKVREQEEIDRVLDRTGTMVRNGQTVTAPIDELKVRRLLEQAHAGRLKSIRALFFDHWFKYDAIPIRKADLVCPVVVIPRGVPMPVAERLLDSVGLPPWRDQDVVRARVEIVRGNGRLR